MLEISDLEGLGAIHQCCEGVKNWLAELKQRIQSAQQRASLSVNRELILLYWQIGRDILERQDLQGWGAKVIDRLAHDLTTAFPDMKGFSRRNLLYMRSFAERWPDAEFVQQAVAQIPWGHNILIITKCSSVAEAASTSSKPRSKAGAAMCWRYNSSPTCMLAPARP
jgi:predicted nuclease of restriction endonuclease-like (RecB) superfamily